MAENFKKLRDDMSPEHRQLAKETAQLAIESIQRDKMLIEMQMTILEMQEMQDAYEKNKIANEILSGEDFAHLMDGAAHNEVVIGLIRKEWKAWIEAGGKSWTQAATEDLENKPKPPSQPLDEEREWEMDVDN